jgi:rhodanese-related sulfurtransferase
LHQITPRDLHARLQQGDRPLLLDVREPWEFSICRIEGSELIPMSQVVRRMAELDKRRKTVVICHHGIRSQQVALYLDHQGFSHIVNLQGGVAAWARDVDPAMPTY